MTHNVCYIQFSTTHSSLQIRAFACLPDFLFGLPLPHQSFQGSRSCTLIRLEVLRYCAVPGEVGGHRVLPEIL